MLRIADFRVLYENTFYHSRWLNIWHWFCGFSLKSRILIFYYLASHTDRSYPIIHRWTFCTSLRAKYNNLLLFGKRSFSFGLRRNIFIRVLFFKFILMQEAIFDAKYAQLKKRKVFRLPVVHDYFYLAACYCLGISCGEKEIVTSPEQSTNE